jgi:hypothetical protein
MQMQLVQARHASCFGKVITTLIKASEKQKALATESTIRQLAEDYDHPSNMNQKPGRTQK